MPQENRFKPDLITARIFDANFLVHYPTIECVSWYSHEAEFIDTLSLLTRNFLFFRIAFEKVLNVDGFLSQLSREQPKWYFATARNILLKGYFVKPSYLLFLDRLYQANNFISNSIEPLNSECEKSKYPTVMKISKSVESIGTSFDQKWIQYVLKTSPAKFYNITFLIG